MNTLPGFSAKSLRKPSSRGRILWDLPSDAVIVSVEASTVEEPNANTSAPIGAASSARARAGAS